MYAGFAEASYTETITDNSTTVETGNSISGTYTSTASDTTTTTDTDVYSNSSGTVTVTEWSSQTTTTTTTGNNISTAYTTVTNTAGQSYTMTETGSDFTLTETGSLSSNSTGSGNTIEGTFSTNTTGTDNYTMHEHGINTDSQSFCQSITGTDEYTISETGNNANQTDTRDISGSGSYSELLVVASSPTVLSGDYSLSNSEDADARSGALSQSGDLGRYALLTYFVDVSNADASTPGNMNFSPVGRAFVDPVAGGTSGQAQDTQIFDPYIWGPDGPDYWHSNNVGSDRWRAILRSGALRRTPLLPATPTEPSSPAPDIPRGYGPHGRAAPPPGQRMEMDDFRHGRHAPFGWLFPLYEF